MASSLVVEGPSSSEISERLGKTRVTDGTECKACGTHAIPSLYYVMAASSGLFTTIKIMLWL